MYYTRPKSCHIDIIYNIIQHFLQFKTIFRTVIMYNSDSVCHLTGKPGALVQW